TIATVGAQASPIYYTDAAGHTIATVLPQVAPGYVTDAAGHTVATIIPQATPVYVTDAAGHTIATIAPSGNPTYLTNAAGQTTATLLPSNGPIYLTDSQGHTTATLAPKGNSATPVYLTDGQGHTTATIVPTPVYLTDKQGHTTATVDPASTPIYFTDSQGHTVATIMPITSPLFLTDSQGHTTATILAPTEYLTDANGKTTATLTGTDAFSYEQKMLQTATRETVSPTKTLATNPTANPDYRPLKDLTPEWYFFGAYMPTLIAVLLRLSVGAIYAATKMVEPFYSLSKPEGSLAKSWFNINWLATNDSFDPFIAMFSGHWLMLMVSVFYTSVALLTPFASELLTFVKFCETDVGCGPELRVNHTIAHVLEALLAFVALCILAFWWMSRRHTSGIYHDPSSIATIASLLHNPDVLNDFRRLDPDSLKPDILAALRTKRYKLGNYQLEDGTERYGIIPAPPLPGDEHREYDRVNANDPDARDPYNVTAQVRWRHRHHAFRIVRDVIFGLVTAGCLVIIVWYYKNSANVGFERFLDSQSFGPRFIFTVMGIVIHSQWKRIEREVCIAEPWRILHHGQADARSTILAERSLTPSTTFPQALRRKSFFVAYIASIAFLSEALIFVLGGIPYSSGQLFKGFLISAYISMAILSLMLISLVILYLRPSGPLVPRTPNTLASVMLYLCGSRLCEDYADLSTVKERVRDRLVLDMGRRYGFREQEGVDGKVRWNVDFEDVDQGAAREGPDLERAQRERRDMQERGRGLVPGQESPRLSHERARSRSRSRSVSDRSWSRRVSEDIAGDVAARRGGGGYI
ncbi:MAG: hypothetical protein M1824_002493, partial [Vezdaea acicularis]